LVGVRQRTPNILCFVLLGFLASSQPTEKTSKC